MRVLYVSIVSFVLGVYENYVKKYLNVYFTDTLCTPLSIGLVLVWRIVLKKRNINIPQSSVYTHFLYLV